MIGAIRLLFKSRLLIEVFALRWRRHAKARVHCYYSEHPPGLARVLLVRILRLFLLPTITCGYELSMKVFYVHFLPILPVQGLLT